MTKEGQQPLLRDPVFRRYENRQSFLMIETFISRSEEQISTTTRTLNVAKGDLISEIKAFLPFYRRTPDPKQRTVN